jgi:alkanesulfonate monooxygenase SsuD/methylene tetrahydromethanopterin reductase-like flavin-dependent oxidoreductase (luciferase family)
VSVRFGISVVPYASAYREIVGQVLAAERGGLELVGIQDHPYQRRFLDTFALIGDLLARTERLRFFPDVASLPMRPPPMLAKAAASLDVMSGGRFDLGVGAGAFWDAIVGMGGPRRRPGEAVEALEEAITIVRAALDGERVVRGTGPHYPVPGYPSGPVPERRVEIWVGAMGPRMLRLIGRLADGWVPGSGVERVNEFSKLGAQIDEAAAAAGRDPTTIRRIVNAAGVITSGERGSGRLEGPPDQWIETLTGWALEHRIDAFVVWPPDTTTRFVERLATEIGPAVRQAVERG